MSSGPDPDADSEAMPGFQFATATRIVFGPGSLARLPGLLEGLGRTALVVLGGSRRHRERVEPLLSACGVSAHYVSVAGEPRVEQVTGLLDGARSAGCDLVVGVGGGSVIDAAKAVSALLANDGDPFDFLEVVGRGRPLEQPAVPFVAVPTTSGTGAEVTKNAVLTSSEHRVKVSLRSDSMLPRLALIDSDLTLSVPPEVTAATGLDALTQVLEPFVSRLPNPLTDALSQKGLDLASRALRRAFRDGGDRQARADMALVSLFGGLSLANAKLGAVHGFAGPIGGMFPAPHGAVCARLLPPVMRANVRALRERQPDGAVLSRYREVARRLTGQSDATVEDGIAWLAELVEELGVPPLSQHGLGPEHVADVVTRARAASSMRGNPIELTPDELSVALSAAL